MSVSQTRTVVLLAVCFVLTMAYPQRQESSGSYRIRPNTLKEFHNYGCQGEYNKGMYANLNRVCSDCQNLYRDYPTMRRDCKLDCFRTYTFQFCVKSLEEMDRQDIYDHYTSIISEPSEM